MSAEMFVLRLLRFLLPQPVVCKVEAIRFFSRISFDFIPPLLPRERNFSYQERNQVTKSPGNWLQKYEFKEYVQNKIQIILYKNYT